MAQHPRKPARSLADLEAMTPRERELHRAASQVLELMRREGLSFSAAARRVGSTPAVIRSYLAPALRRERGRWVALPTDRLLRVMRVLAEDGIEHEVVVRGSRVASLIAGHWSAIGHYLDTEDASRLERFRSRRVAGHVLETDLDAIDAWQRRGELQVEDIYSLTS